MQKSKTIYHVGKKKMIVYRYRNNTVVGLYNIPLVLWRSMLDQHREKIPANAKIRVSNPNEGAEDILIDAFPKGE